MAVYGVECCPYLGLKSDVSSYRTYPTVDAACLALPRSYCPSEGKQHLLCHSRRHAQCPRFAQAGPSTAARRRLPFHRQPYAVLVSFVLVALILFAFGLRVAHLGDYSLWWDETLSFHRANGGLLYALSNRIMLGPVDTIDQHPPLYFVLLSGLIALAGKSEFVMRFPSVAFTVLAVPLAFVTGSRLAGRTAGIAAAALWATSSFLLWAAWEARPYALLALLSALSIYLLLRILHSDHQSLWTIAWIVSLAAALATHYIAAILIPCEVLVAASYAVTGQTRHRRLLIGGVLALGVAAVPASIYVYQRLQTVSEGGNMAVMAFLQDLPQTLSLGEAGRLVSPTVLLALIGFVTIGGITGMIGPSQRRMAVFMVSILAVPFLGLYLLLVWKHIPYNSRYSAFLAPGYYLLLALGIARLKKFRRIAGVVALLCVVGIALSGSLYVQFRGENVKQDLREASMHIVQEAHDGDAVVLASPRVTTALQYYEVGSLPQYVLRTTMDGASPQEVASQLAGIAKLHPRIWILNDYWFHAKDADFLSVLDASYTRLQKTTFTRPGYAQDLFLYQTTPRVIDRLPAGVSPVDAALGNTVRLIGYQIKPSGTTPGRIYLTLFWQALATPPQLRAFGELTDQQGRIWASFDGEPHGGFFPTTTWKQGDIIVDERELDPDPGAPPGRYSLSVGLRRSVDSQALPVVTGGRPPRESMPLGDVELQGFDSAATRIMPAGVTHLRADVGPLTLLAARNSIADLHPGESMPLRLYWQLPSGDQPIGDINVRVALVAPNGNVITSTVRPLADNLPNSPRPAGALLASDYALRIPRSATSEPYRVAISVGPGNGSYWRFGPPWWIFGTDRAVVATVRVHAFDRQSALPSTGQTVQKDIGGVAQLSAFSAGVDWRVATDAGGALALTREGPRPANLDIMLYWRAQAQIDQSLTAFVQLLDADGRLAVQHDSIPQLGKRPTSGWLPPEVIADPHPLVGLENLRPGRYLLIAGLYDSTTGRRLPTSGTDHIALGTIVLP